MQKSDPCAPRPAFFAVTLLGLRYHTQWDYKTLYYAKDIDNHSYIAFPAVTICPLAANVPGLTDPRLFWGQFSDYSTFNDSITEVYTTTLQYRGATVNCIQFNNQPDILEEARGPQYGLVIRFSQAVDTVINTWNQNSPYPLTGAIGILHVRQTTPVLSDAAVFYAPLGQTVEVSVWNYYRRNFAGFDESQFFQAIPSLVSNHGYANTSQIVLAYNQYGFYIQQPYHVYRAWDWIGEVGGAAALLFFLQHGIVWATIGCARRTCYREAHRARKRDELEDARIRAAARTQLVANDAAAAEAAVAAENGTAAASPQRKPRRPRNQPKQNDTDIEMAEADKPQFATRVTRNVRPDGRVVIDMDSLAEDSE